jgi:uncharacterized protein YcfL
MKSIKLTAAFALLFAAGCATGPAVPQYLPNHVNITDADLDHDLTRLPVIVDSNPSGITKVTVPVRSNRDFTSAVDYKFTFLDAAGVPVDANPAWQPIDLDSAVVTNLTGTCPVPGATDWKLDVRPTPVLP